MLKADLTITNAKVFLSTDVIEAGIAIVDGKIAAIGKEPSLPKAEKTIDARGRLLIPGVVDGHVHVPVQPEYPGEDSITSVSAAAAVGGVTLIGIMPFPGEILTEDGESFRRNKTRYEGKSRVDFSMLGAFGGGEGKDFGKFIPELWNEGAIALKGYMHNHRPNRQLKASYDGEMLWALENIAKVGAIANVHCENEWMQTWNMNILMRGSRRDAEAYLEYSPPIVEYEAGRRFLYFCKVAGARGLMVHTSLPELVMEAENGKSEGYPLYVETCPHYLYFSEDDFRRRGIWLKCAPPVRDKDRMRRMWQMLGKGYVDTIASDYSAASRSVMEEADEKGDVFMAGAGMPHIEHMVSALMNGVNRGWTDLFNAVKALTEKPARIYGLYPRKGAIQVGSDADIVMVDMNKEMRISQDTLITKAMWSSFEGLTLKGTPVLTMVRGEVVAEDRVILGKPEYGSFVPRQLKDVDSARQ